MSNNVKNIARWIVLLPASVVAMYIAGLAVSLISKLGSYLALVSPDSVYMQILSEVSSAAAAAFVFVYSGVTIAPSAKRLTTYVLSSSGLAVMTFITISNIGNMSLPSPIPEIAMIAIFAYLLCRANTLVEAIESNNYE